MCEPELCSTRHVGGHGWRSVYLCLTVAALFAPGLFRDVLLCCVAGELLVLQVPSRGPLVVVIDVRKKKVV